MSNPAQKQQLSKNLTGVIGGAVADGNQLAGQGLPCSVVTVSGAIVTVAFEVDSDVFTLPQVKCPIAESEYAILPIQVGDKGYVTSASARLGGVSGLGSGLAPLVAPSNLGGLVFVPVGNKAWTQVDANAIQLQGPNGAIIQTMDGASRVTINETQIELNWNGNTVIVNDSGITLTAADNTINGDLFVNGNSVFTGNVTITENLTVQESVIVTGDVSSATMTCAGLGAFGSLEVGGKPFLSHEHEPGTYEAGSTHITGVSGGVAP